MPQDALVLGPFNRFLAYHNRRATGTLTGTRNALNSLKTGCALNEAFAYDSHNATLARANPSVK